MVSLSPQSYGERHMLREDLEISAILRVLWFHKVILLSVFLITSIASIVYFSMIEKAYRAEALIKMNELQKNIVNLNNKKNLVDEVAQSIESSVIYLTSPTFLKQIVKELNLTSDPEFAADLDASPRQTVKPKTNQYADRGASGNQLDPSGSDLAIVAESLREHLDVRQVGSSYIVAVSVTSSDPKKAASIANSIADAFLSTQLTQMKEIADSTIQWLDKRITELRGELAGIEGQIINYKVSNQIEDFELGGSIALQQAELATQLAFAKADRSGAIASRDFTKAHIDADGELSASRAIITATMSELRSGEVITMRSLSEAAAEYGNRHPVIISLQRELTSIRQRMRAEVNRVLQEQKNEVAINLAREMELEAKLGILETKTTEEQQASIGLIDLQRDADVSEELLTTFLTQHAELLEQAQIFEANAEIMSPANIPTTSHYPKPLISSLAIAFSTVLAAGIGIFFHDRWISDFGFKSMDELRDFGIDSLGIVPDLLEQASKGYPVEEYVLTNPQSAQAVALQHIRTRLYQFEGPQHTVAQSVMITSSLPLEGKTTTAVILARQAAEAGLRTLLIDADLRRPRISDVLGIGPTKGLSDLLAEGAPPIDEIVADPLTPLHFLSAGLQPHSPPDLFRKEQMRVLMSALGQTYEWIVIDTPPIGAVSDCLTIGQHVNHCVYVARWRSTPRNVILSGMKQIEETGTVISGVILSRVNAFEQQRYGSVDFGQHYGRYQSKGLAKVA